MQVVEVEPGSPLLDEVEVLFRRLYAFMDDLGWRLPLIEDGEKVWRTSIEKMLGRLGVILVALEQEQVIGFVHGAIRMAPAFQGGHTIGVVTHIYVVPEGRGKRVGEALAEHLIQWFQAKGVHSCELQVVSGNDRALGFWKRLGFEEEFFQLRRLF